MAYKDMGWEPYKPHHRTQELRDKVQRAERALKRAKEELLAHLKKQGIDDNETRSLAMDTNFMGWD